MTTEAGPISLPLSTLAETERGFAHVNRGKVEAFRALGLGLVLGAREGARFQDAYSGRWYWNCHCNGGVFNLGHRHPRVVDAVRAALDEVDIGNHHLMSPWRAALAERLVATTGGRLQGVVLGVSGSEVVDTAVKLARGATGRSDIVSAHGAYHGVTGYAMAAGDAPYRDPFGPRAAGFSQVPWNDLGAIDAAVGPDTAAVLLEAIPATLGFPPPEPQYLQGVQRIAHERGALLVLDEVQTGLGRTGSVWFHEQEQVAPDAIVIGKGLSGGVYPIAALLTSAAMHEPIDANPFAHSSTFGGSELGCAAALAVLEIVTGNGFLERVRALGERFEAGLADLPFELRRRGMTMALAFEEEGGGLTAAQRLLEAGVFAVWANNDTRALQFKPPLTTTDAEADEIIALVRGVLGG